MLSDRPVIGAILLAAGSSTRLGQPKQLLSWQGQSLLRHAAQVALASEVSPIAVVLGSQAETLRTELDGLTVDTVIATDWEQGMGTSLQAGLRHLQEIAPAELDAVLVLLCDQPLVSPEHLRHLIDTYRTERRLAVASEYSEGIFGPPCLFRHKLFPKLQALTGAQGARAILGKLDTQEISRVSFPEGLRDVDTWNDWKNILLH